MSDAVLSVLIWSAPFKSTALNMTYAGTAAVPCLDAVRFTSPDGRLTCQALPAQSPLHVYYINKFNALYICNLHEDDRPYLHIPASRSLLQGLHLPQ